MIRDITSHALSAFTFLVEDCIGLKEDFLPLMNMWLFNQLLYSVKIRLVSGINCGFSGLLTIVSQAQERVMNK